MMGYWRAGQDPLRSACAPRCTSPPRGGTTQIWLCGI